MNASAALPHARETGLLAEHRGGSTPVGARLDALVVAAGRSGDDVDIAIALARDFGLLLPLPGSGGTGRRWDALCEVGRVNLTVARVLEAHADALAILAESRCAPPSPRAAYGVFAAEGAADPLHARPDGDTGRFILSGTKPWCSLGSMLDRALVTAHVDGGRRLFDVDLRDPRVSADATSGWVARGLRTVTSTSLRFAGVPASPVGGTDWYLTRPGFAWGGLGVAACWLGGARGLQDRFLASVRRPVDDLSALHLGSVDAALHGAEAALAMAAAAVDLGEAVGDAGRLLALRVRSTVVAAAELALRSVGHALGPRPLAFDEDHARHVADLELYLRQHHGERDLAALGHLVAGAS